MSGGAGKAILNFLKFDYWATCWETNKLIWQMDQVHPFIASVTSQLKPKSRVLIPMCGKTLDMGHLSEHGHQVVGVEFAPKGVEDFFSENQLRYKKREDLKKKFTIYEAVDRDITIFCGDFFTASPQALGDRFDVVWDRGAFVAMNPGDRAKFCGTVTPLTRPTVDYFLEAFDYEQSEHGGPPFSVARRDVDVHFGGAGFDVERLNVDSAGYVDKFVSGVKEEIGLSRIEVSYYKLSRKKEEK